MQDLTHVFKAANSTRRTIAFLLSRLTVDQINTIPKGANNNILWNAAHIISVQQLIVNRRAGAAYTESKELTALYKPGTLPTVIADRAYIDMVSERLVASGVEMEKNYHSGMFDTYEPFTTRTKMELASAADAITFELFHVGLHLGYIMSYMNMMK